MPFGVGAVATWLLFLVCGVVCIYCYCWLLFVDCYCRLLLLIVIVDCYCCLLLVFRCCLLFVSFFLCDVVCCVALVFYRWLLIVHVVVVLPAVFCWFYCLCVLCVFVVLLVELFSLLCFVSVCFMFLPVCLYDQAQQYLQQEQILLFVDYHFCLMCSSLLVVVRVLFDKGLSVTGKCMTNERIHNKNTEQHKNKTKQNTHNRRW